MGCTRPDDECQALVEASDIYAMSHVSPASSTSRPAPCSSERSASRGRGAERNRFKEVTSLGVRTRAPLPHATNKEVAALTPPHILPRSSKHRGVYFVSWFRGCDSSSNNCVGPVVACLHG